DHSAIDPNMQTPVLSTTAFYGDKAMFDRFLAEFTKSKDKQVRRVLLSAMNSFRDPAAIESGMSALIAGTIPFIEGEGILFNGQQEAATRKIPLTFLKS